MELFNFALSSSDIIAASPSYLAATVLTLVLFFLG